MVEVVATDEFANWYDGLSAGDAEAVARGAERLEKLGVALGFPHSSALKGTKLPLRELRIQSGGRPLRVVYAFDPLRQAVLLIGGDKTGDTRFYEVLIPQAERIWEQYLAEQAAGLHKEDGS
jgi:hypothetical protein